MFSLFQLSYSSGFQKSVTQLILDWFSVDRERKRLFSLSKATKGIIEHTTTTILEFGGMAYG